MSLSAYWTHRRILDQRVEEAKSNLDRARRITRERSGELDEALEARRAFLLEHKDVLDAALLEEAMRGHDAKA